MCVAGQRGHAWPTASTAPLARSGGSQRVKVLTLSHARHFLLRVLRRGLLRPASAGSLCAAEEAPLKGLTHRGLPRVPNTEVAGVWKRVRQSGLAIFSSCRIEAAVREALPASPKLPRLHETGPWLPQNSRRHPNASWDPERRTTRTSAAAGFVDAADVPAAAVDGVVRPILVNPGAEVRRAELKGHL